MSVHDPRCPYLLIVDADQYSGNYERQLTGFCTGVDDGTHGEREGDDFREWLAEHGKTVSWERISTTAADDNGYPRVATIWTTPGRLNNGLGFHYDAGSDDTEARQKYFESTVSYREPHIAEMRRRLDEQDFDERLRWNKESCERTLAGYLKDIEDAKTVELRPWPAYESVAIFLTERPAEADMAIFLERLRDFAQDRMEFGKRTGKTLGIKRVFLAERQGDEFVEVETFSI